MPFLPIVAAGVTAAAGVKGLVSGGGGGGGGLPDPSTGFFRPVNQSQLNAGYQKAASSVDDQKELVKALSAQGGIQNQSQVYNQLQDIAAGNGPNPAQAQLANATGANVANQAALMASQRGTAANTGLIARQAATQGGNLQQQAAGQGAALQAQQSQNAIGQAGNLASQQVGQQLQGQSNANTAALGLQGNVLNAQAQYNSAVTGNQNNSNSNNTQLQMQQNAQNAQQAGNLLNAAGTIAGKLGTSSPAAPQVNQGGGGVANTMTPYAHGGEVSGPRSNAGRMMKSGGKVPGEPMRPGQNVRANDTVKTILTPKEIVLPLSVTQSKDPAGESAKFVQAILARNGGKL